MSQVEDKQFFLKHYIIVLLNEVCRQCQNNAVNIINGVETQPFAITRGENI